MSTSFAHALFENIPLTPATKFLKNPSEQILPSLGIVYVLPIKVNGTMVNLSFYIFDIMEFDLLIGQPIERLFHEGQKGNLNIKLGKNFKCSLPITHSSNAKMELNPEQDPMDEVVVASLSDLTYLNLEEDAQHFV